MLNEILHIITDPAHWVGEVVMDGTLAIPAYFLGRWRLGVHDRKIHNTESN